MGDTASSPAFLITIDTEGDNSWSKPRQITTKNAEFLPRFQSLCEKYGLKPTYLTNYEMAQSPAFQEFGRDIIKRHSGEIGMHLHAWNSPPLIPLTADDFRFKPYLIEYPEKVMRDKIDVITNLLEETFGVKMTSHRAGRWSFNETYAKILVERGYRVDCSVTPHLSWSKMPGDPDGNGGTDFSCYPDKAYFVDLNSISCTGDSDLLELPVTIIPCKSRLRKCFYRALDFSSFAQQVYNHFFPVAHWLRPNGRNRAGLLKVIDIALKQKRSYVEFMLHSSELMPGGSPRFPTGKRVEILYADMEALFSQLRGRFEGATLKEYYQKIISERTNAETENG